MENISQIPDFITDSVDYVLAHPERFEFAQIIMHTHNGFARQVSAYNDSITRICYLMEVNGDDSIIHARIPVEMANDNEYITRSLTRALDAKASKQ